MADAKVRESRRWFGVATIAVVVLAVVIAALVLTTRDDDSDDGAVDTSTTTTEPESTTTEPESTTTTEPAGEVVVDPIDMGPTPPPLADPPETLVAVRFDGWLVLVDTATGEVLEELDWSGDLRDDSDEAGAYGIWQVAVAADRSSTWVSSCCEPAAGHIRMVGSDDPGIDADNPHSTMSSRWFSAGSYFAHLWTTTEPGGPVHQRIWVPTGIDGLVAAVLSPDGSRLIVEPWPERDSDGQVVGRRPMLVVETATVRPSEDASTVYVVDDDPVELPNDRWTLPTFRRDGLLLVAEEADDGTWQPRLVDLDTFEVIDAGFAYGDGVPVMQRYDGSGEWLLVLLVDDPDAFPQVGRLIWFGPEGRSGTIPGAFLSAAW